MKDKIINQTNGSAESNITYKGRNAELGTPQANGKAHAPASRFVQVSCPIGSGVVEVPSGYTLKLRRLLKPGNLVRVVGNIGGRGQIGSVVCLALGCEPDAAFTNCGYWTVEFSDGRREVMREHLRCVRGPSGRLLASKSPPAPAVPLAVQLLVPWVEAGEVVRPVGSRSSVFRSSDGGWVRFACSPVCGPTVWFRTAAEALGCALKGGGL